MKGVDFETVVNQVVDRHKALFLIDCQVSNDNKIAVTIDGDESVSMEDCIGISREIEAQLDRETEDFSLTVTSAGVAAPLQLPRQYKKNIGRKLKVKTEEQKYKAKLIHANDQEIELQWKQREPKPVGKGKHTVEKKTVLTYDKIKEAKVVITFK